MAKSESELDSLYITSLIILCFFVFFIAISFIVIVPVDHARRERERKRKHKKKQEQISGYSMGYMSNPLPLNLNRFPQPLYGFQAYPIS
jgi:hypothetical protein